VSGVDFVLEPGRVCIKEGSAMTLNEVIDSLETLRAQLQTMANAEIFGLVEALKRDGVNNKDSSDFSDGESAGTITRDSEQSK
jgi:hypothetical protein